MVQRNTTHTVHLQIYEHGNSHLCPTHIYAQKLKQTHAQKKSKSLDHYYTKSFAHLAFGLRGGWPGYPPWLFEVG